jgi:hypothetical protein
MTCVALLSIINITSKERITKTQLTHCGNTSNYNVLYEIYFSDRLRKVTELKLSIRLCALGSRTNRPTTVFIIFQRTDLHVFRSNTCTFFCRPTHHFKHCLLPADFLNELADIPPTSLTFPSKIILKTYFPHFKIVPYNIHKHNSLFCVQFLKVNSIISFCNGELNISQSKTEYKYVLCGNYHNILPINIHSDENKSLQKYWQLKGIRIFVTM